MISKHIFGWRNYGKCCYYSSQLLISYLDLFEKYWCRFKTTVEPVPNYHPRDPKIVAVVVPGSFLHNGSKWDLESLAVISRWSFTEIWLNAEIINFNPYFLLGTKEMKEKGSRQNILRQEIDIWQKPRRHGSVCRPIKDPNIYPNIQRSANQVPGNIHLKSTWTRPSICRNEALTRTDMQQSVMFDNIQPKK